MRLPAKLYEGVARAGLYGSLKSAYYSLRHTGDPTSLIVHSKTITDLAADTAFDVNGHFSVGIWNRGATHPRLGRSVFTTTPGSSVAHTGQRMANVGPCSVLHVEGEFAMGDSYVNSHSRILCGDSIAIGDGVQIGWNCELLDDDRHRLVVDDEPRPGTAPIEIRDDVWIGHDVTVHKGVTIGEGSVVASDSVVTSDVPSNALVAGCPATVVEEDVAWE